jgi:drug/metabolite transporter (DMT)-like permease
MKGFPLMREALCFGGSMDKAMPQNAMAQERIGAMLVFGSAVAWSFGGAIARFLTITDSWTIVFWRSLFAGIFLLGFLIARDGPRATLRSYQTMGVPGLVVGIGFAIASISFIIAIGYTTVANVVLIQAVTPLIAALLAWIFYGERITLSTWIAIAAVIFGVGVMVSGSLGEGSSWIGTALAVLIPIVYAIATVVTRRYQNVRQTPGVSVGCFVAVVVAATQASSFEITWSQLLILIAFGVCNLGLGMALWATGARMIPSALAALLGTAETMLSPVWVAIFHHEIPGIETVIGGLIVLVALIGYLLMALRRTG